jgi:pimeloyl-ACP methyl ester carboxylesterase
VRGVSTPRHLRLPPVAKAYRLQTRRGPFAVHDATPPEGVRPLGTALLVPGFTGSKEDFLHLLEPLTGRGWRTVAVDQRGQYETPGPADLAAYDLEELGRDVLALGEALGDGPWHLVGHSFGGLVARSAVLQDPRAVRSVTLLGSGPGAISGHEADKARLLEAALLQYEPSLIWEIVEAAAREEPGHDQVPQEVRQFLRVRFVSNTKAGLLGMVRALLATVDRTEELSKTGVPLLVAYGEDDYVWSPAEQADMARRLGAAECVVRGAAHSPAVEQAAATAAVLAGFWESCPR